MENREHREAWNKGRLVGQKAPLKLKDIWAIRIRLQNTHEVRASPCSTLLSTANSEAVTSSAYGFAM